MQGFVRNLLESNKQKVAKKRSQSHVPSVSRKDSMLDGLFLRYFCPKNNMDFFFSMTHRIIREKAQGWLRAMVGKNKNELYAMSWS